MQVKTVGDEFATMKTWLQPGNQDLTIISGMIMAALFLSELRDFLNPSVTEELFVDTSRGSKLKINFDIITPHISCDLVSPHPAISRTTGMMGPTTYPAMCLISGATCCNKKWVEGTDNLTLQA
ncbi:hypothetical protein PR048_024082 [Dryococelus australis]|uniref:Endoplasmic reticulum vesicle transporter N-terminal domain-containing protein n=1 Tax=Dryococelus australis TaxID=614101 RepID=A0ABQ9GVZ4_9NEOP|nr:hypothetical protein PR048_024082 [Dryococelus australis]